MLFFLLKFTTTQINLSPSYCRNADDVISFGYMIIGVYGVERKREKYLVDEIRILKDGGRRKKK
jgi:hypothetical protein